VGQPFYSPSLRLSEAAFELLAELIHRRTGLTYDKDRMEVLESRLSSLVLDQGMNDFLEYYYMLKYHADTDAEWARVQTALAVSETYFWREVDQLRVVANQLVPQLLQQRPGLPIRIWHAGCCSGEEPYSMVMALRQSEQARMGRYDILATDANQDAIALARRGLYGDRSFRVLPEVLKQQHFTPHNGKWQLHRDVMDAVFFETQNLMQAASMGRRFDFIFCRNVFIYFSARSIEQTAAAFHSALEPGGYLLLGASESLLRYNTPFEFAELGGAIGYRKRSD
jgi:chemotaxis protein methyltransferase CheR